MNTKKVLIPILALVLVLGLGIASADNGAKITVEKDYRFTDVCFEKDNDLDGLFNEDPVDFDADNNPIDNDLDGLFNEDDVDCPLALGGTSLGALLPVNLDGNYTVEAVVNKNRKVSSYNPGQYYAVSTVNVLKKVDTLTIVEDWCDCTNISTLNPRRGGGRVVIVNISDDGVAYQLFDANSGNVTFGVCNATATLGAVSKDTTILMYVKFGPAQKHETFVAGTCLNTNNATATKGGSSTSAEANATLQLIEKGP